MIAFDGGDLSCTAECTLDSDAGIIEMTSSGGETATTGEPPDGGGCACRATLANEGAPTWAGSALLALLAWRRRRFSGRSQGKSVRAALLLLAGLGICAAGCGPEDPAGESMGMTSTGDDTSSTGSTESVVVDPRFFGTFHNLEVGYVGMTTPEGAVPNVFWSQREFRPDHTFVYEFYNCPFLIRTTTLEWEYIPEQNKISILTNEGDEIVTGSARYSELTFTIDDECDGLNLEAVEVSGGKKRSGFLSRGRVCAVGDSCEYFEIVWCDEGDAPPLCGGS